MSDPSPCLPRMFDEEVASADWRLQGSAVCDLRQGPGAETAKLNSSTATIYMQRITPGDAAKVSSAVYESGCTQRTHLLAMAP